MSMSRIFRRPPKQKKSDIAELLKKELHEAIERLDSFTRELQAEVANETDRLDSADDSISRE